MRTEAEIRAAAELFSWYVVGGRIARQDRDTQQNITGAIAVIEWVLNEGLGGASNPISNTLTDIAAMRAGPERN